MDYRAEQRKALGLPPVPTPDAIATQSRANERRHSQFKHGGGPAKTAERRAKREAEYGLSDAEMGFDDGSGPWNDYGDREEGPWSDYDDNERGLTDEEMFADAPAKPLTDDERWAARFLRPAGLGLGFGDEVVGGLAAAGTFLTSGFDTKAAGDAYRREQAKAEDISRRYEEENPVESIALDIVSGGPAGALMFKGGQAAIKGLTGAKKLGVAGNIGALGLTGAGASSAYSAGAAPQSIEEKFAAAVDPTPLLVGGGLGVVAGPVGNVVARGASRVGRAFMTPQRKAARYIAEKLRQSEMSPEEWAARQQEAAQTGKPAGLADTGPQGVRDAAAMAAREPGQGREFAQQTLRTRQEGQAGRVTDDLRQASGTSGKSFTQTTDEITARRAAEAKPLYEKAMSAPPLSSPKLTEVMNRPSAKEAMQRGLKIAQNEGVPLDELVITNPDGSQSYTMKGLHYAQQALGDMIESAQRSGDGAAARAFTILRGQLLGEMDRLNPSYAKARSVFAGHSANERALNQGRNAVRSHPDQIKSEMAGMSESEREFFRQGFVQRVVEDIENSPDGANAVRRIFGNAAQRERLKAVLGEQKFAELERRLGVEQAMFETNQSARLGSQTAERMGASEDFQQFIVGQSPEIGRGFLQAYATGSIGPLARSIGWPMIMNLFRGASERTRHQISRMLLSSDPQEVRRALNLIAKEFKKANNAATIRDAATGAAAANKDVRTMSGIAAGEAYGAVSPWAVQHAF